MSTDTEQTPAQIEQDARNIGWVSKEEFRGNAAEWVDAKEYLERGKTFIPYLQADRKKLLGQVTQLNGELSTLKGSLSAAQESISALREYNSKDEVKKLEGEVKALRQQLAEARKEGETELEVELETQLDDTRDRLREAKGNGSSSQSSTQSPATPATEQDFVQSPEFQTFLRDNPWFTTDPVMAAASTAIGQQMAVAGELANLTPAQRFARIAEATRKRFGVDDQPRGHSRVEGGGGSSAGSTGGESKGKKSYSDLPPEAQAACDKFSARMVGKGKAFATKEEWQKKYTQDYFNS